MVLWVLLMPEMVVVVVVMCRCGGRGDDVMSWLRMVVVKVVPWTWCRCLVTTTSGNVLVTCDVFL